MRLDALRMNGPVAHDVITVSGGAGAVTVDWSEGNWQQLTLTGDATLTFINAEEGANLLLDIIQNATGGHAVTWPSGGAYLWAGGGEATVDTAFGGTPPAASINRIQSVEQSEAGQVATTTVTIATPTVGNLLVAMIAPDKIPGAMVTVPSGWTLINSHQTGTGASFYLYYKVADGTEGALTWTWTTDCRPTSVVVEYEGLSATPFDVESWNEENAGTALTLSTGTTGTTAVADSLCLAFFANDTEGNVDAASSYLGAAELILSATQTVETTCTVTGTADQCVHTLAVFSGA